MIITDFKDNYLMYENMLIREFSSFEEFLGVHEMLKQIFSDEYGFTYEERNKPGNSFSDTPVEAINKLLDYFGDKYFFVFTLNDAHYYYLLELQDKKIINFGIDLKTLDARKVYVLEMDKTKELKRYDTI
ncbi:MAG: hypothetical protein LC117_06505 [Bacteroidia bacterium]|nr:hypothetical protein [Bacteroidia bacterium]MCZ2277563.1 hypothetical protein [Bacteroidia bacterium]